MRSLTTNRSVSTAQIITDNGKNVVSQKQKADGFVRLYRDVSKLRFEKHERGMKKAFNSSLRSEVVDRELCQDFTTDEVKAAVANIRPRTKGGKDQQKVESYRPMYIYSRKNDGAPCDLPSTISCQFDAPVNRISSRL